MRRRKKRRLKTRVSNKCRHEVACSCFFFVLHTPSSHLPSFLLSSFLSLFFFLKSKRFSHNLNHCTILEKKERRRKEDERFRVMKIGKKEETWKGKKKKYERGREREKNREREKREKRKNLKAKKMAKTHEGGQYILINFFQEVTSFIHKSVVTSFFFCFFLLLFLSLSLSLSIK